MYKQTRLVLGALGMTALIVGPASGQSIKHLVDSSTLSEFCSSAGLGSTSRVSLSTASGSIKGSIRCEAEDIQVSALEDENNEEIRSDSRSRFEGEDDGDHRGRNRGPGSANSGRDHDDDDDDDHDDDDHDDDDHDDDDHDDDDDD